MPRLITLLFAILSLMLPLSAAGQVTPPSRGGTGASTTPAYGDILVGNATGTFSLRSTSSLGIQGGGAGTVSSTNPIMATYVVATGTASTSTFPRLSITTAISFLGDFVSDATAWIRSKFSAGAGIDITNGVISLNATGDWTGTLDGQEGSYYLANSFSSTSASNFVNSSTTIPQLSSGGTANNLVKFTGSKLLDDSIYSESGTVGLISGSFRSSSAGDLGASFGRWTNLHTNAVQFWSSGGSGGTQEGYFGPVSGDLYLNFNDTNGTSSFGIRDLSGVMQYKDSGDAGWTSFDSLASGGAADGTFSTTSADYWQTQRNFFSTTSTAFWETTQSRFGTTTANYWLSLLDKGYFFSTTSANFWETQQTARTADDLTNNSIEDLSDVAAMTENYGDLLLWNGTNWTDAATNTLRISWNDIVSKPAGFADDIDDTAAGGSAAVATATAETAGHIPYWTTTSGSPARLGSVATGTLSCSGPLSCTSRAVIGGASTISLSTAGDWTGTLDGFEAAALIAAGFSTTSADHWQSQRNFFSTTSAAFWETTQNRFGTTTANHWLGLFDKGYFFSTTSANFWETAQTARTADNLGDNNIADLLDVDTTGVAAGNILGFDGSNWVDMSTSSYLLSGELDTTAELKTLLTDETGGTGSALFFNTTGLASGQVLIWNGTDYVGMSTSSYILASEIDTYTELNAITSDVTLTHNGLIDTSSELAGILSDEFGSGRFMLTGASSTQPNLVSFGSSSATTSALGNIDTTGDLKADQLFVTGATSSFASGINLAGGCFAMGGTCLSLGSASYGQSWLQGAGNFISPTTSLGIIVNASSTINGALTVQATSTGIVTMLVKGMAGQTADLFAVDNSAGTRFFSIDSGGAFNLQSQLQLNSAVFTQIQATQAGVDLSFQTVTGTGDIVINPNATEFARFTDTRRLGLGTTSPWATLSVAGNAVMGSLTATSSVDFSGATVKQKIYSSFTYATTTWTGTTTFALGPAGTAETLENARCFTDTGTVWVNINDGTNKTNHLQASTTVNAVTLSSNNSFTLGEKRYIEIGNPASSPRSLSCTLEKTVN